MKTLTILTILLFILIGMPGICSAVVLTTSAPVGSSLTTDDYGVVTSFIVGSGGDAHESIDYASSFVVLDAGSPLEVFDETVGLSIWAFDNSDPGGDNNGYFLPDRFEAWTFNLPSDDKWHTILEYHDAANNIDLMGGIGYMLIDPSPALGYPYVEWKPAFQFTNIGENTITLKNFRYIRVDESCIYTLYSNHYAGVTDYDGIDGTSDDYALGIRADYSNFFMFGAAPLTHYRIQSFTDPLGSLYDDISDGDADYDIANLTDPVFSPQGETGLQYETVSLEPDQALIYWLYPKPILVNNSDANHPTCIDYDSKNIEAADEGDDLEFANDTDVTINYSDITPIAGQSSCTVTVAEITGGMIETAATVPLTSVSNVRYWEIYYDTRRSATDASITFTYDPDFDGVPDDNALAIAYRTDYDQDWTRWADVSLDAVANTITANNVDIGDAHWALGTRALFAPINPEIEVSGNDIIINWQDAGKTTFHIYRSTNPYSEFAEIATTSDTTYTDTGAATQTKYFYYITAE